MGSPAILKLLILNESEIRKAAALLRQAMALVGDKPGPLTTDAVRAVWHAFDACVIALAGADGPERLLMLSAAAVDQSKKDHSDAEE